MSSPKTLLDATCLHVARLRQQGVGGDRCSFLSFPSWLTLADPGLDTVLSTKPSLSVELYLLTGLPTLGMILNPLIHCFASF